MIVDGKNVADLLFNLIDQEENMLNEINNQLAQINIHTDIETINKISSEINEKYQEKLYQNLLNQSELIKDYEKLSTEEKIKFIHSLQDLYSEKFAAIRKFDNTNPSDKYDLLDKYFSHLKGFDKTTAPYSVNLVKLSAIKRIIYPAGIDLIKKVVSRLKDRELKVDDTKSDNPFATSPHIPHNSNDYPQEVTYKDSLGSYKGAYPYPEKEQTINETLINDIYLKDPNNFVNTVMNNNPKGIYKAGLRNDQKASDIKEILVIVDPKKIHVQIGENKDGKLVFYASHRHLAIHHEELHMVRGLRGNTRGENGLPKQLERAYHNLEEFLTITGAKSNERLLNEQMALPLRVGHSGATIGESEGSVWIGNFVATQLIHDPKDLSNINFSIYKRLDLSREYHKKANFSSSNLSGIKFQSSILQEACFDDANLEDTLLSNAEMANASLVSANLNRTDFTQANLVNANLNTAILDYTNLTGANLLNAQLKNTEGMNANFQNSNLMNTNFTNAFLKVPDFTGANLTQANFEGATFRDGIFDDADFSGAIFKNADFGGADLTKAKNLDMADFTGVDLSQVKLPMDFGQTKKETTVNENKEGNIVSNWQGHPTSPKFSQLHSEREIKDNPLQVLIDNGFLNPSQNLSDNDIKILSNPTIQEAIRTRDITVDQALKFTDNHLDRIKNHSKLLPLIAYGYLRPEEPLTEQEIKNLCNKHINDAVMCGELEAKEARQLNDEQVKRILTSGWDYDKVIGKIKIELAQQLNTTSSTVNLSIQKQSQNDIQNRLNNNHCFKPNN